MLLRTALGIGFLIFAAADVSANELDPLHDIHWLKADVPPIGITSGPLAGKGLHGGILEALLGRKPDPDKIEGHANMARLYALIQSGNYCVPGMIKTSEREEFVYFTSLPSAVLDSSHLVYAAGNRKLRDKIDEDVSLQQLLDDGFVVGVGAGISYGDGVDEVIQNHSDQSGVLLHPTPNFIEPILSMIEIGRVDFSLAPPWVITWLFVNRKLKLQDDQTPMIVTHPFREAAAKINYHVACAKNDWGKQAVALLDKLLARSDVREALDHNASVWMSAEKAQQHLLD
ncbi:hypothetical protein HED22_16195 [Thalassospira sp. HF15]|uniref:hypothetical protein n=1 Tax=Thalassospira sp. HF15 TaxID=2722755 RepID=UPI0014309B4E|nr:hypothetical protein [Thalassospira sp. HF15]NIY77195.1 hypothetical protein [Thalassospira sp. HF15]